MATKQEQPEKKQVLISCTVRVFVPQTDLIISLITFTRLVIALHYAIILSWRNFPHTPNRLSISERIMSEVPFRYFGGILLFDWVCSTGMEPGEPIGGAAEWWAISTQTTANSLFTGLVCKPAYGVFMGTWCALH